MPLWTDVYDPAELTGFARAAFEDLEGRDDSLAQFLPNKLRDDITVSFTIGENGLVEEAEFRAYDAPPSVGSVEGGKRVVLELPAIGREHIVSEYAQLKNRNAGDEAIRAAIERTAIRAVKAVSERMERQRGIALLTGKSTINQVNFKSDDDFGRDPALTHTAAKLWDADTTGRLEFLEQMVDLYTEKNGGIAPGVILAGRKAVRLLKAGDDFKSTTGPRVISNAEMGGVLDDHGIPPILAYNRRTRAGLVIPENTILFLPAPGDPNDEFGTDLGATYWGRTLTSQHEAYNLAEDEQSGIVVGVTRGDKPPMIAEVVSDAIGLPVLENANLSLAVKVAA